MAAVYLQYILDCIYIKYVHSIIEAVVHCVLEGWYVDEKVLHKHYLPRV